jgi:hypothetical protein
MKTTSQIIRGSLKLTFAAMIGAALLTSCSKGTVCPAYKGAQKKYSKHAQWDGAVKSEVISPKA